MNKYESKMADYASDEGHIGKILSIDLSTGQLSVTNLEKKDLRDFIGGLGLGIKYLYDEVGPNIDAMSPDNVLIFAPGPLSGTAAPTSGRCEVVTKSPLTGIIGRGNFGGAWGARLKKAGFEAVVIRKNSNAPVYVFIDNGIVYVKSAEHIWGKDTWETTDILKKELGDNLSVLSIGPAGENLIRFACPVVDYYHAAGRSHAGCVMGVKKLKAIVIRGTKEVPIADPHQFNDAVNESLSRIASYPVGEDVAKCGQHLKVRDSAKAGAMRTGNFGTGALPPDSDIWLLPNSFQKHISQEHEHFCYHCQMAAKYGCDLLADVNTGKYKGLKLGGVCFSFTSWYMGGRLGIRSYPAMWKYQELCNRYGMDRATPIPFVIDLFENNIVTKNDLGGLELKTGDETGIMEMLGLIAYRQGFGDVLAEGSDRVAKHVGKGADKWLATVKGMELTGGDPRAWIWGKILGTAVCPRGGDDLNTTHSYFETFPGWAKRAGWSEDKYMQWWVNYLDMTKDEKREIFGEPPKVEFLKPDNLDGKAALAIWHEKITSVCDSLGTCLMSGSIWCVMGPSHLAKLYTSYSGWQLTSEELMKTGDRLFNLMKAYIVREGLTRKDDDWPVRYYAEPWQGEIRKGSVLSKEKMNRLLDEYYGLRGWDKSSGVPTKKKLIELGLNHVADELVESGFVQS